MRKKLTTRQKARRSLIGGVAGLILGFWFIFILKNNLGFFPAILGALLLIFGRR